MTSLITTQDSWLKEENPDLYSMLQALEGSREAQAWLVNKSPGLSVFTRAIGGDRHAEDELEKLDPQELDYIHGTILNCEQTQWLAERSPELGLLFLALKGDEEALKHLKHRKRAWGRLAERMLQLFARTDAAPPPIIPSELARLSEEGVQADVGLLVGEYHLQRKEYVEAVEAFNRAIATSPTPDAYDGRARAYLAMAQDDERRALQLREYEERNGSHP
jgi:tetratricopeptide (TPR) repeat protein